MLPRRIRKAVNTTLDTRKELLQKTDALLEQIADAKPAEPAAAAEPAEPSAHAQAAAALRAARDHRTLPVVLRPPEPRLALGYGRGEPMGGAGAALLLGAFILAQAQGLSGVAVDGVFVPLLDADEEGEVHADGDAAMPNVVDGEVARFDEFCERVQQLVPRHAKTHARAHTHTHTRKMSRDFLVRIRTQNVHT